MGGHHKAKNWGCPDTVDTNGSSPMDQINRVLGKINACYSHTNGRTENSELLYGDRRRNDSRQQLPTKNQWSHKVYSLSHQ